MIPPESGHEHFSGVKATAGSLPGSLTRARPLFRRLLLCTVSVWIFSLSFPGGPCPWMAWMYLVPAALGIRSATAGQGLALGLYLGFFFWLQSVWWVSTGLNLWVDLPLVYAWLFTALYCLYAAIPYGVFGWVWGRVNAWGRCLGPVGAAALLTVLVVWFPNLFPGNPSHSLYTLPLFLQILDLGGMPLLLFVLNLVNLWIAEAVHCLVHSRSPLKPVLLCGVVLALVAGYGKYRICRVDAELATAGPGKTLTIASVQPNIPLTGMGTDTAVARAVALSTQALASFPGAELVVWPELPVWFGCHAGTKAGNMLAAAARSTPFLVMRGEDGEGSGYYNTAMLVRGAEETPSVYRKMMLVPFGEFLPLEEKLPWLRQVFPGTLAYRPGNTAVLFDLKPGIQAIPSICYEVVFSAHIRAFVEKGGNFILNMTDDAWFGPGHASSVHLALGLFRAVEFRLPLVRVTNSGNGCFVRATGEIVPGSRTLEFVSAITAYPLKIPETASLYLQVGDLFLYGLTCYAFLALVCAPKRHSNPWGGGPWIP